MGADFRERVARRRRAAAAEREANARAAVLDDLGLDDWGPSYVVAHGDVHMVALHWPLRPRARLEITAATARLFDGDAAPRELDGPVLHRLMEAVGIVPLLAVQTPEQRQHAFQLAAIGRVPHTLSHFALGTEAVITSHTARSAMVEWRHLGGVPPTLAIVSARGVSFGPWRASRDGAPIRVQWERDAPWAAALADAFGYAPEDAAREDAPTRAMFDHLFVDADPRARASDAEFTFFTHVVDAIDRTLLRSPPLVIMACDALRQVEVSTRMEELVTRLLTDGDELLWALPLDLKRVRDSRGNVKLLLWLAGRSVSAATAHRLRQAYAVAEAERAAPDFADMLTNATWAALSITHRELLMPPAGRRVRAALFKTRPPQTLARQLFWGVAETTSFVRCGGKYVDLEDEPNLPLTVMPDMMQPQFVGDSGLPAGMPPTAAALSRVYRTFLLAAPMGARKSTAIVYFLRRYLCLGAAELDRPTARRILQISPRRAFGSHATGVLQRAGFDFQYYGDSVGDLSHVSRLVIQVESLHRMVGAQERGLPPHVLIIDEAAMVFMQLCSASTHGDNMATNAGVFRWALQNAAVVIIADAFLTPAVLMTLRYLRGGRGHDAATQSDALPGAYMFHVQQVPDLGAAREVPSYDHLTHEIALTLCRGAVVEREDGRRTYRQARIACCVSSATKADLLAEWINGFNAPGHPVDLARRRCVAAAAADAGFGAEWVAGALAPLRVRKYIGGQRTTPEDMRDVGVSWSHAALDVLIFTTTAAVGISYVGWGVDRFDRIFFYGCAGSDVCRVQAQMVRRIRNPTDRCLTYALETRGVRPPAVGITECRDYLDQRALVVTGILVDAAVQRLPPFMQALLAEHENEVAICRYAFSDTMGRYLELAGYAVGDEAAEMRAAPPGPARSRPLPALDAVPVPDLAGVPEAMALATFRHAAAGGFRLEHAEQLWVSSHNFIGLFGARAETARAELAALWPLAINRITARWSAPFAELQATLFDPARRDALRRWATERFVDTVPARMTGAWAVDTLWELIAACGGPHRAGQVTVTADVFDTLVTRIARTEGLEQRLTVALHMRITRAVPFCANRLLHIFRAAFKGVLGARVTVVQRGIFVRRDDDDLIAAAQARAAGRPPPRFRRRELLIDLRPWWRARGLILGGAALADSVPEGTDMVAWWADVVAAFMKVDEDEGGMELEGEGAADEVAADVPAHDAADDEPAGGFTFESQL